MLETLQQHIDGFLWRPQNGETGRRRFVRRFARYPYALIRDAVEGQLTMRAMSLVYTTLLSVVPLIALSFSILKAFDVHYQLEPLLANFLAPLGTEQAGELSRQVTEFVENVRGVALGSVGLLLLLYTVISMVQKVEESVNYVWQVQRTRSLARRFSEYLSIVLIAPLVMLVAVGLISTLFNNALTDRLLANELISETVLMATKAVPFAMVTVVFTFIYVLIPNTRVRFLAALAGGLTASVLWVSAGAMFASFVAGSTSYTAIYTTFAAVIIALIWLYANWLILLVGAKISFYVQNPEYLRYGHRRVELSHALQERLAVQLMARVGAVFAQGGAPITANDMANEVGLPGRAIGPTTRQLEQAGLLIVTDKDLMLPGRALDAITLQDILYAVRETPTNDHLPKRIARAPQAVDQTMTNLHKAMHDAISNQTLGELVRDNRELAEAKTSV
ncbi:MAG: YhjD/YihY/BrkB family envelope integrity protein [Gammaproteobacteria bacterium]